MSAPFVAHLRQQIQRLKDDGVYKDERVLESPQAVDIQVAGERVLNFCANNYLGLAGHPRLVQAARESLETAGYGMASVRFICGTQSVHKALERRLSDFLGTEDSVLFGSCFDANGGLFEALLDEHDAVISDAINHASIIDGVRLSKAKRLRYAHDDMADLEAQLVAAADARFRIIATDGVFSMDGIIANLKAICELADRYGAMVMVDDSHGVGLLGAGGRGTPEHCGVMGRIDFITGTLGKALGGAAGGYVAAKREIIDWLRNRSRPYLFSNATMPAIAATSLVALDIVRGGDELRSKLSHNATRFRREMTSLGFTLAGADHPIVPVMLGDAVLAAEMANRLLKQGVYVISFSFPVVPRGQARIRVQLSAAHEPHHITRAVAAFESVGRELGVIG